MRTGVDMRKIVGVDVGGTYTDVVLVDEDGGDIQIAKVFSTPGDQAIGLMGGLGATGTSPADLAMLIHGTTVATNAVIERRGARCGLITTRGFRDIIELRRRNRPHTYGLIGEFEPLVPRERRLEVDERTDYEGNILVPLNEAQVEAAAKRLLAQKVEAVAVCFLHSYANPRNEEKARKVLERVWPNSYIVLSSEIMPEFREFERGSTTVVNAYVQPLVGRYLDSLARRLRERGYNKDILLMQSNGGVMSVDVGKRLAINTISSGPAAGVIAAAAIARVANCRYSIACDMGGTSLDISLIVDDAPCMSTEAELEYGIPVKVPMIDIRSVGAGGGSIAWVDKAGILQIGPRSAGAEPGPVCYQRGGKEPTVTDANLVLGRLNPQYCIGQTADFRLDVEGAKTAIGKHIGAALGLDPYEAAFAILEVANSKMAGQLRLISTERGHDPREFALVMYGGAGPLHANALLRQLSLARAVIPFYPGLTCALGCIMADVRHDFVRTVNRRLDCLDLDEALQMFAEHVARGTALIAEEGVFTEGLVNLHEADMNYDGQIHQIRVSLPSGAPSAADIAAAFEAEYRRKYGAVLKQAPIRLMCLRTTVRGLRPKVDLRRFAMPGALALLNAHQGTRRVYFERQWWETPIYERPLLPSGARLQGPAIIEQRDSTAVIEPGTMATVDNYGNLILEART
jgi:N-methylhydantoinase A